MSLPAFDLALQHHQSGRLQQAEQIYREILAREPQHFGALHHLGVIALQFRRDDVAAVLIRRAVTLAPEVAEAHSNLGNALLGLGQLDEAIASYRIAIKLKRDCTDAMTNLSAALRAKGQLTEAIEMCRRALGFKRDSVEAYYNLGMALNDTGNMDDAIRSYRSAIKLRPTYAEAHNNLGNCLQAQSQLPEAINEYRLAISINPGLAVAHFNLGNALTAQGLLDEAIIEFQTAIAANADNHEAHGNLGNVFLSSGQVDLAIEMYRKAVAINPLFVQAHSNIIYAMHLHPACDQGAIDAEIRLWNERYADSQKISIVQHSNDRNPNRRIRIGYVSSDFMTHASAHFLVPLLNHHNSEKVEIFCYANVRRPDAMTGQLQNLSDHWRSIFGVSDDLAAQQIRSDRIDILVDLKLHTSDHRLGVFARKPAPVQISWLGYPGTTGMRTIDYYLLDPYLDPRLDGCCQSEKMIALPQTYWCYDPLEGSDIAVSPLPCLTNNPFTFGCLNSFGKVNAQIIAVWAKVLQHVAGSRMLLLAQEGSHRQSALAIFEQQGADPRRIAFVPRQSRRDYLEKYHQIDIGLDSFPYNGHTTSLDSLWMGVPVVTLVGETAVARAGWSLLNNLGLTELAAQSSEQFIQVAVDLAHDKPRLQNLRASLRSRMEQSPLMDSRRFAANLEKVYRQTWRHWCETQPS